MKKTLIHNDTDSQSAKSRKLASKYRVPFSVTPLSLGGLRGSLVIVGLGGTISGGTAKKRKSVSRSLEVGIEGRGLVCNT